MCYIAKSKKERTKYIANKDILVYKVAALVNNYCESVFRNYTYIPNVINKRTKLHYKHSSYEYRHEVIAHKFIGHTIDKGYHSYVKKELCVNNLYMYAAYACVKYMFSYKPLICIECIIPKGTKYCLNKQGEIVSETIIYTGHYESLT